MKMHIHCSAKVILCRWWVRALPLIGEAIQFLLVCYFEEILLVTIWLYYTYSSWVRQPREEILRELRMDVNIILEITVENVGFPGGSDGKGFACRAGDLV